MTVSIYSISNRFRKLFRGHIEKQMQNSYSSLLSPTDISFGNGKEKLSYFSNDDFIIFYMVLDYPVRFSCCLEGDFREAYLNARTNIAVEVFGRGEEWWENHKLKHKLYKTFIPLNKCIPLSKIYVTERSKTEVEEDLRSAYRNCYKKVIDDVLNQYLDYLIACVLVQRIIPEEFKEVVTDHYRRILPHHKMSQYHKDFLSQIPRYKLPRRIPKVYSAHLTDFDQYTYLEDPYFVTTWDDKEGFQDKWMFFGDLLKEAEKIKNGPHPCTDHLRQYPELNKMLDIDELWLYNLWQHFILHHTFTFLEKDWYGAQNINDYILDEFRGDNYRIKTSEELITQQLEPPKNLVDDGFDEDTMTTYAERREMHIKYLKHIANIPKTVWGYKKEPCPISDVWFKMHGYTE